MSIAANLARITEQVRGFEQKYNREPGSVKLLAISKKQPLTAIKQAITAGQYFFGENYVQEALPKVAYFADKALQWHFVGSIQSNKTRAIAENFAWAHSVTAINIARRLNDARPSSLPPLNICIQVNISNEQSKGGIKLDELFDLANVLQQLPNIRLRGLMAIPAKLLDYAQQQAVYQQMATALQELRLRNIIMDTLSMGMSADFEAAIAAGSTIIRIGQAIFGPRH